MDSKTTVGAPVAPGPDACSRNHLFTRMATFIERAALGSVDTEQAQQLIDEYRRRGFCADEPLFLLRGRDGLAGGAVMHWVARAYAAGVGRDKLKGAIEVAAAMVKFDGARLPD